jgi:SAM-dependent methyltransferase
MTSGAVDDEAPMADFNVHAPSYAEQVQQSISFCGTEMEFFVRRKAEHLLEIARRCLGDLAEVSALDAGCGIGTTDAFLTGCFGALHGIDVAAAPLVDAAQRNADAHYTACDGLALPYQDATIDLAFAVCVLHHVTPANRPAFIAELRRVVRPGGLIVIFEHNPFNPLTRLAVSRCDFDKGVELLSRRACSRLLTTARLQPVESGDILFTTFDRPITRRIESRLRRVPFGAQHYVAARR